MCIKSGQTALEGSSIVEGAASYLRWREKYVRKYRGGLYVAYNDKRHEEPANAVTVSEAWFYTLTMSNVWYVDHVSAGRLA